LNGLAKLTPAQRREEVSGGKAEIARAPTRVAMARWARGSSR
jgi:hypothetical protein